MRAVVFREVLHAVADLLGITPDPDLSPERAAKFCAGINRHVRSGMQFLDCPELRVLEERVFRPFWRGTAFYSPLTELFDLSTFGYYRVKAGQMPGAGVLPTNTTYFEPVTIGDRFIPLDADCRQAMGEVLGVYSGNPRGLRTVVDGGRSRALYFRLSQNGVDVQGGGRSVFVLFKIRPPRFTTVLYDGTKDYLQKALVYFADDGEVYRARVDAPAGLGPGASAYWAKVMFPERLLDYVTLMSAADNADDAQSGAQFRSEAQEALVRESDSLIAQGDRHFYRPLGAPGRRDGWRASLPCEAVAAGNPITTTLSDECVDEFGEAELDELLDNTGNPILDDHDEPILTP